MPDGTPRWTCVCGRRCTLDQNRCLSCGEAKTVTALVTTIAPAKAGSVQSVTTLNASKVGARPSSGRIPVATPGPDARPTSPSRPGRPAPRPDPTADDVLLAYAFPNGDIPGAAPVRPVNGSPPPVKGNTRKFSGGYEPPPSAPNLPVAPPPLDAAPPPPSRTASGRFAPPPERPPEYMLKGQETGAPLAIGDRLTALFGDARNRDIAITLLAFVIGIIPLRWEMKVWSANQLVETKSYNLLQEDFAADIAKELGAKGIASGVQKDEIQMLCSPGLTGKGSLVFVTIRSPSGGLYAQYEGPTTREPGRCQQVGFKFVDHQTVAKKEQWTIPGWRMAVRWLFMFIGLGGGVVCFIRILVGGKGE